MASSNREFRLPGATCAVLASAAIAVFGYSLAEAQAQPSKDAGVTPFGGLIAKSLDPAAKASDTDAALQTANAKIVNGTEVTKGMEWMVAIGAATSPFVLRCGGALVAPRVAVSAAHCGIKENYVVIAGRRNLNSTSGGQTAVVSHVESGAYNKDTLAGDYTVLLLDRPMAFKTIDLEKPSVEFYTLDSPSHQLTIAGWGRKSFQGELANKLLRAPIKTKDFQDCKSHYAFLNYQVLDDMFCGTADKGDACSGDSGGPVMENTQGDTYMLVGIVSWGLDCGQKIHPGIYVRVNADMIKLVDKVKGMT
jgi:secreted trypsin-like serine protease